MSSLLFNSKYRIASSRLQTWDYGNAGMYFITICTANREFYFGEIDIDVDIDVETRCIASLRQYQYQRQMPYQMQLSEIGKIAETEWIKTIELRPDMNLELGEFVVMPNHFHGIIIIHQNQYQNNKKPIRTPIQKPGIHCSWL